MAKPWRHPTTKAFYIYRQIPAALRPAFGGKQFWKKSLHTRDPEEAKRLFIAANSQLEGVFDQARAALARDARETALTAAAATDLVVAALKDYDKRDYPTFAQVYFADEYCVDNFGMNGAAIKPLNETLSSISPEELAAIPLPGDVWLKAERARSRSEWIAAAGNVIDSLIRQSGRAVVGPPKPIQRSPKRSPPFFGRSRPHIGRNRSPDGVARDRGCART